jgi:hypothetical protein
MIDFIFGLVTVLFTAWVVYLLFAVADYINAYPFNGGWPF